MVVSSTNERVVSLEDVRDCGVGANKRGDEE